MKVELLVTFDIEDDARAGRTVHEIATQLKNDLTDDWSWDAWGGYDGPYITNIVVGPVVE